jgi:cysteine desulfurase / selenocysteine lyase
VIYLDHAATSWPKPPQVLNAMCQFLQSSGNPGRSGHCLSVAAGRSVYQTRELIAEFFHAPNPLRVIFTQNVTHALNLAIAGLLQPGDRVVTTSMEHNSVMRPLRAMEKAGTELAIVPCDEQGRLDLEALRAALVPRTKLVVVNHASNVTGTVQPLAAISQLAHQAGALFLIDAAQTAGVLSIDQQLLGIDLLAFTGHKGLQGPPGTGGLIIGEGVDLSVLPPILRGGTGSYSEHEEQPEALPDKYESGTQNGAGIAGLGAGVRWLIQRGPGATRAHEVLLTESLIAGLMGVPGVTVYGLRESEQRVAVVSFTISGMHVSDVALRLEDEFGILCRVGLHCAPAAHRTIGTFPEGTVRLVPGPGNTTEEIQAAVSAVARIACDHD